MIMKYGLKRERIDKERSTGGNFVRVTRSKRPGIHVKTKTSKSKNATNYKKKYRK